MNAFLIEHNPGQGDTTGRFKKKVSTTLKQAETRKTEREKSSARGLKFSDKFANCRMMKKGFIFFCIRYIEWRYSLCWDQPACQALPE